MASASSSSTAIIYLDASTEQSCITPLLCFFKTEFREQFDPSPKEGRKRMYTTRPLSVFKNGADGAIHQAPATGPNSGYLLLRDEEAEPNPRSCCGLSEDTRVRDLPFPQNRILTITYTEQQGEHPNTYNTPALFIPVLDKPLSSNHYYVIIAKGKSKGKAYTSSKEEDMTPCCFCRCVNDVKPSEFNNEDIYQQLEIVCKRGKFTAKSVAPGGIAPWLLRNKYWTLYASKPKDYDLAEATGLDKALRARMPELEFPISRAADAAKLVVGKWYTPCVFVKEGGSGSLRDQMKRSTFYEIALEQRWEEIYACENLHGERRMVEVEATVRAETALLDGREATVVDARGVDGTVWFKPLDSDGERVGLNSATWERMRWEQKRGGWASGDAKVERVEEYGGVISPWKRFVCYVLVERFVVKRKDGSVALMIDFKHADKIQTKWD